MIITKLKDRSELLQKIAGESVFIIGCSECATLCHTGGEPEVSEMRQFLEKNQVAVTGDIILDPACHLLNDKRMLKSVEKQVAKAQILLVLACGSGVQTVHDLYPQKQIISGTDSLFLAETKRATVFERRCALCGECIIDEFSGLCPITRCPKSMLNGPCGGSTNGKCEVDETLPCVWDEIYSAFKEKGQLQRFREIQPPKDWSKSTVFVRRIEL